MPVLSVDNAKEKLDTILEEIQNTYEPLIIASEKYSAVLISENVWRSIEETLYLTSIADVKEKIEDCTPAIEW